jgi:hypothetical protein
MQKTIKALPWIQRGVIFAAFLFGLAAWGATRSVHAAELVVTTLNDSGPGSLRQAIADAATGDTITFAVNGTITLTSGPLAVNTKNLEIAGPGEKGLTISANHSSRVFVIGSPTGTQYDTNVTLAGMTIGNGLADGSSPVGQGIGGGILNGRSGSLTLSNVVVSNSQALGDAKWKPAAYYGAGYGGGVANLGGRLTVIDSSFIGNLARGGDDSVGDVAGLGGGGGIFNSGYASIEGSRFTQNQAIGGNDCSGTILTGHGAAGALMSGGFASTLVVVSNSVFDHNQAIGGNGSQTLATGALGAGKSSGGAIDVTGGTATFDGCTLEHNVSIGGSGHSGGAGGIGAGGGMMVTNVGYTGSNATIRNSVIRHNKALGGPGGLGGNGGDGEGGGFTSIQGAALTVINSSVEHNHAQGGESGVGGNGGNGQGGGLFKDALRSSPPLPGPAAPSSLILEGAIIRFNLALVGEAVDSGFDGTGVGGGVYHLEGATSYYSADSTTVITKNQATTSNNNVWP